MEDRTLKCHSSSSLWLTWLSENGGHKVERFINTLTESYNKVTYGKVFSQDILCFGSGEEGAGSMGQDPMMMKAIIFLFIFPAQQHRAKTSTTQTSNLRSHLNRLVLTKGPSLIFTTQQLQQPRILSMQRSSAEPNSWADAFHKKPLAAKTKGINIVTHISYTAEDFKRFI